MDKDTSNSLLLYSLSSLLSEVIEELKDTTLYSFKLKNLLNQVQPLTDNYISKIYSNIDDNTSKQYHSMIKCIETFLIASQTKDSIQLIALLQDFIEGDVMIMEGDEIKEYKQ